MDFDSDEHADAFFDELRHAVEQQMESPDTPYVAKTFERLTKAGMPPDDAKEAMAQCLAEETDRVLRSKRPFDVDSYRKSLERISPDG